MQLLIGADAIVTASNTVQLGSASVTLVQTSGTVSAAGVTTSGNITAAGVTTSGNITAAGVTTSGNITAADVTTSGNMFVGGDMQYLWLFYENQKLCIRLSLIILMCMVRLSLIILL